MTWKNFIDAIKEAEIYNKMTPTKIVGKLFSISGRVRDFSDSAVQKWLSGIRNCKASSYFPDGKIKDEQKLFEEFKKKDEDKLYKLQEIFRTKNYQNSLIDTRTDNIEQFCWSLVNQFLSLLEFDIIENFPINPNHIFHKRKKECIKTGLDCMPVEFINSIDEYSIGDFIDIEDFIVREDFIDRASLSYPPYLIEDAFAFANHIRYVYEHEENSNKDSDIYKNIITFNKLLYQYLALLQDNSSYPSDFPYDCRVKIDINDEAYIKAKEFCVQLKALCDELVEKINRPENERYQKQVDEIKEENENENENEKVMNWRLSDNLNDIIT